MSFKIGVPVMSFTTRYYTHLLPPPPHHPSTHTTPPPHTRSPPPHPHTTHTPHHTHTHTHTPPAPTLPPHPIPPHPGAPNATKELLPHLAGHVSGVRFGSFCLQTRKRLSEKTSPNRCQQVQIFDAKEVFKMMPNWIKDFLSLSWFGCFVEIIFLL